jgi:hypothetical protein
MRKVAMLLGFTLLVVPILLPVTRSVNTTVGNPILHNGSTQAGGTLLLPSAPKKTRASAAILVADGSPLPPPPKKPRASAATVVADGSPLPPPPKKPRSTSISFAAREQASA